MIANKLISKIFLLYLHYSRYSIRFPNSIFLCQSISVLSLRENLIALTLTTLLSTCTIFRFTLWAGNRRIRTFTWALWGNHMFSGVVQRKILVCSF